MSVIILHRDGREVIRTMVKIVETITGITIIVNRGSTIQVPDGLPGIQVIRNLKGNVVYVESKATRPKTVLLLLAILTNEQT